MSFPIVEPIPQTRPTTCPHCGDWPVIRHGQARKPIRDLQVQEVTVVRYRCQACHRTFRHYPNGVTAAAHSQRLILLAALLWGAGLSLRWCEAIIGSLGAQTSDTSVWRAVQRVGAALRQQPLGRVRLLGVDGTGIGLAGETVGLVVAVDCGTGQLLQLELLDEHDPRAVLNWLQPLVTLGGVAVLVTDDLGSHRTVATTLDLPHAVCGFHLKRWVGRALRDLERELGDAWQDEIATLRALVQDLPADGISHLQRLERHLRDVRHPPPSAGPYPAPVRLRQLVLRLSEHWPAYCHATTHPGTPTTNNRTEQAIGRLKLRSRTVRHYKSRAGLLHGCLLAAALRSGQSLDWSSLLPSA